MRHGERTNKIPTYGKRLQSDGNRYYPPPPHATGNYTHPLTNRVNYLIALLYSYFRAHPNKCAPTRGVDEQMRNGERTNKSPTCRKMLQSEGTPNKCAPTRGVDQKMRNGERTNKSPIYGKCFSPKATGNYTHNTLNRVNNPIAYIPLPLKMQFAEQTASHLATPNGTFQSDSFYSHYFRIQRRKNPSVVYTFVECDVPQGTTHKVRFHTVILHRAE
jgi:hypothetical protein